jgi:hypothetical protein
VTERPAPDASKLLADWMEWERGEVMPGRVMSNLKTHGMRELLESLAAGSETSGASAAQ